MASQCNDKCECCPDHDTMLEPVLLFLLECDLIYSFASLILVSNHRHIYVYVSSSAKDQTFIISIMFCSSGSYDTHAYLHDYKFLSLKFRSHTLT